MARIASLRGDKNSTAKWRVAATQVAANVKHQLWISEWHSIFNRDANDSVITTLVHDSLRYMWQGMLDVDMAHAFVANHLMNRSEFWTPAPLPSISLSDPRYNALKNANSWSGRPMGLTYQRAIRALERYGHHAEVTMLGLALTSAILDFDDCRENRTHCHFTLEIDPMTRQPMAPPWAPKDGYGPMLLAFLEYTALRVGVVLRSADPSMGPLRTETTLLWSAVCDTAISKRNTGPLNSVYSQKLGNTTYSLEISGSEFTARVNDVEKFRCTVGARVVTTLNGDLVGLVGITANSLATVTLSSGSVVSNITLRPNDEYDAVTRTVVRTAPFTSPF